VRITSRSASGPQGFLPRRLPAAALRSHASSFPAAACQARSAASALRRALGALGGPGFQLRLLLFRLPGGQLPAGRLAALQQHRRPLRRLLPAPAVPAGRAARRGRRGISVIKGKVLSDPEPDPGIDQLLQLRDLRLQLPSGHVRGHRRARLQLGPVPGHHLQGHQALPRARLHRLRQQPADRLLVPPDEPGHRRVIGMQVPADHPRPDIIERGHLDLPRRPQPLAIAIQQQARHHRRVIRLPALPVAPVRRLKR
jgi:hypothetical protein